LIYTAQDRMNPQAYNYVGNGNVQGASQTNPDPSPNDPGTDRDSKNIDIFIFDHIKMNSWNAWLGVRRANLERESEHTDGSRAVSYYQNFTLPWAALSYNSSSFMSYISYGQGLESFVTPNRSTYNSPGKFLPNVISRQWEIGAKGSGNLDWNLALFQLSRPLITDQAPVFKTDGRARQRGVEVEVAKKIDQWTLQLSVMKLEVIRKNSSLLSEFNNNLVVNTPEHTLRALAGYEIASVKGLSLDLRIIHEGERAVTLDNEQMLPSWTRLDAGLMYLKDKMLVRLYIENLADKRYWRESPTQYGHIYLYPGADRRIGLNLQYGF
jgi:iron complex outermembrane receptor protein